MPCLPTILKARPHKPRGDAPAALPAEAVEIVDDDDDDDVAAADVAAASSAALVDPGSYVADVRSGAINGSLPASAGIALPADAEALLAAGGDERYLVECADLYRYDEPLLALRRLLLLEPLVAAAGLTPLRERTKDVRISIILRTEVELDPMLKSMLGGWTLISRKSELQVETWLQLREGGRAAVKVTGVVPHDIAAMSAPLLFPELYSTWIPGIRGATQLQKTSNFRRIVHLQTVRVPVPFLTPRDAIVTGYGDIYSPTCVTVYLKSVEEGDPRLAGLEAAIDEVSPPGSTVRIGLNGGFLFEALPPATPGGPPSTRIQATVEIDPKLKILPPPVIDWIMKVLAANLVPMYEKQARKFGTNGELTHLTTQGAEAPTYTEMRRRLAVLQTV